jgi:hypothetical protein
MSEPRLSNRTIIELAIHVLRVLAAESTSEVAR